MQGPSRGAMTTVQQSLHQLLAGDIDAAATGGELFAVGDLLDSSASLRRALADPMRDGSEKAGVVERLLTNKVHPGVIDLIKQAVSQRWTDERDLPAAMDQLGVASTFVAADRAGRLGQVEEELFRFERTVAGDPQLRDAFVDRQRQGSDKAGLVRTLLEGKVAPETMTLATRAAEHPRGVRFERALQNQLGVAAQVRDQLTATVTSAVPLDDGQRQRLVAALSKIYGRPVVVGVIVDPQVVGGVRVVVGDEVIDGTIASRLDQVRRELAG